MLDFHSEFTKFNINIKLTTDRKDRIIQSRNAVRDNIRKFFKDKLDENQPKFIIQGSFAINTALNALNDEEVDLDDGIYLMNQPEYKDDWIKPRKAHDLILEALKDHTKDGCENKSSCVRVIYKKFYHLDLPIYILHQEKAYLAQIKVNDWINSDSKEFKDWFYSNRKSEQTSRITRYLKAWRDFNKKTYTSIELTILSVTNFKENKDRDDISLLNTIESIINTIKNSRSIIKPVSPYENLWEDLDNYKVNKRIEDIEALYDDLFSALNNDSDSRASAILREIFGERYPKKENKRVTIFSEIRSGSKPWGE